jgi:FMNH2-dependent dimethyl sulfone monooxygenase
MKTKFAYWVPNVSGGLVISKLPQRTRLGLRVQHAPRACALRGVGFDYALAQARFIASYGAEKQLEAVVTSTALATVTSRLKIIAAVHPGLWHPGVVAKMIASADYMSGGRVNLNVVSGWFKDEFTHYGVPWLEHDERYRRSEEFIRVLRGMWTEPEFDFKGDFYSINQARLEPKPIQKPHPEIFQGGNSVAARRMAGRVSDWYFMNGNSIEGFAEQIADVRAEAAQHGRTVKFAVNAFVINRPTHAEAEEQLREIVEHADDEAVEGFRQAVMQAGRSSKEGKGMWAQSTLRGPRAVQRRLQDRPHWHAAQIAERIQELDASASTSSSPATCTSSRRSRPSAARSSRSCGRCRACATRRFTHRSTPRARTQPVAV